MKIALIIPGSGTRFYCENCARDGTLARGLISKGHDVTVCPLYLPLSDGLTKAASVPKSPLFFGAINLYFHQLFPALQRSPRWLESLLDSPPLLRIVSSMSGSTNAPGLGETTVSMLQGEKGSQESALRRLVDWLGSKKPELVHLSNGLLVGIAGEIKRRLGAPVLCSLQDEDFWIDSLNEPFKSDVWKLMAERSADVDLFLPVSRFYAEEMMKRLGLNGARIDVVPNGIDVNGMHPHELPFNPPVIGYLSRISEEMGIRIIIDAFLLLKRKPRFNTLRLRITGGSTAEDRTVQREIRKTLGKAGVQSDVEIISSFERLDRIDFLSSLTLLSVPVLKGEAQGTFMLEAMASGVPVVQPALGGFPEIIRATGGGITYQPNTAESLAEALGNLLVDPERSKDLGEQGRQSVLAGYTVSHMVENIENAYKRCLVGSKT